MFAIPLTLSIWGMMQTWRLAVWTLRLSSSYSDVSEMPGVKFHGEKERWPMGPSFDTWSVSKQQEKLCD